MPPTAPPRLSICLPTHHGRAAELDRALRSIAGQLPAEGGSRVQVCVSDNGSQDATQVVLTQHRLALGDALKTFRFDTIRGSPATCCRPSSSPTASSAGSWAPTTRSSQAGSARCSPPWRRSRTCPG